MRGMIKLVSPSGWDFAEPAAQLVKVAADGKLHANDRRSFIKRASGSENVFLPYLDRVKFAQDEVPVHLIALGALEAYGPNRNGDGFREKALQQYHPTFTKFAKFYRNHKNKDPNHSYGVVKLSAYNPTMRRVELLVGLNATEKAAERNDGFVADQEIEKLARGDDIPVSMACRVPYDECSFCGNRARTREEYCKAASCKAGGCAENLTKLVKVGGDVHHLFVHNDHPLFFDISAVFRPADRIAWASKADWLDKRAADRWVTEQRAILPAVSSLTPSQRQAHPFWRLATGLAVVEKQADWSRLLEQAFSSQVRPLVDWSLWRCTDSPVKIASALSTLAQRQIILPLADFARCIHMADYYSAASAELPRLYQNLTKQADAALRLGSSPFAQLPAPRSSWSSLADRLVPSHSLEPPWVYRRCQLAALRPTGDSYKSAFEKQAHDQQAAAELLDHYAAYQLSALGQMASACPDFLLTARFSACQNQAASR